jgi:AcrR family transcriptional regulator
MASKYSAGKPGRPVSDAVKQLVIDKTAEKISVKLDRQADKVAAKVAGKAAKHVEALDRLAAHLEAIDVWTRTEPGSRKPRFSRADIANAAIRIADDEGFEAVSMRRLAAELDAGTMTLYHYVRTKDELLTLIVDAFLGEVVLPPGHRMPPNWRTAITLIAQRTRDALHRHPWILDITDDPNIGPNAMRHFDQAWQALSSLDAKFDDKLDLITVVDEYVFGFCMHERNNFKEQKNDADMVAYVGELLTADQYPALAGMVDEFGLDKWWAKIHGHARGPARFDRNLARLLTGFEVSFGKRR